MDNSLIQRQHIYTGPIFSVYSDDVKTPEGKIIHRDVIEHASASAIVAVKDNGNILFVRQYRHPVKDYALEIPAGIFNEGECAQACALRELEEETGFKATEMKFLTKFYSSPGFCSEMIYIYVADGLIPGKQNLDFDESVIIEEYSLNEAISMFFDCKIIDSKTIAALLAYKEMCTRQGELS